jgi:hypothetical protein
MKKNLLSLRELITKAWDFNYLTTFRPRNPNEKATLNRVAKKLVHEAVIKCLKYKLSPECNIGGEDGVLLNIDSINSYEVLDLIKKLAEAEILEQNSQQNP